MAHILHAPIDNLPVDTKNAAGNKEPKEKENKTMSQAIETFDDVQEEQQKQYPEVAPCDAIVVCRDAEYSESNPDTHLVKFEFEVLSAPDAKTPEGEAVNITDVSWRDFYYLPKSGLDSKGKPHWRWSVLKSLAKKLGLNTAGLRLDAVDQSFVDQFKGKAFSVTGFKGKLETKKQGGEPVLNDDGSPKQFVQYRWGGVEKAEPAHNVSVP